MAASRTEVLGEILESLSNLQRLQQSEEHIDFTIFCGQRTWEVHRLVLMLHSKVLSKACAGRFKESEDGSIDLSNDEADCVDAMVTYFYNLTYYKPCLSSDVDDDPNRRPMSFHVKMCILADFYDIQRLKDLAIAKFKQDAESNCIDNAEEFAQSAAIAYGAAGPAARICDDIVTLIADLSLLTPGTSTAKALRTAMQNCAGLGFDVAEALARIEVPGEKKKTKYPRERRFQCPRCQRSFKMTTDCAEAWTYACPYCQKLLSAEETKKCIVDGL